MADHDTAAHDQTVQHLNALAQRSLKRFDLPEGITCKLINLSENATYKVHDPATDTKWALRVHRAGYHTRTGIASELAWQTALKSSQTIVTAASVPGRDGECIQTVSQEGLDEPRNVVLFEWETGSEPASTDAGGFELLGEAAARMHAHVRSWQRPAWFERHAWNFDTSLGDTPHWGRWRDGMGLTPGILAIFEKTVETLRQRLEAFGMGAERFGLVHGDMRLANLLMDGRTVKVIDFDDCGFSWFLYDCATTVSFFEHEARVPELIDAWVRGYRRVGVLSAEDEAEIETFILLRRMILIAWIGSHSETDLAQSMGVDYTATAVPLCERYLSKFGPISEARGSTGAGPKSTHRQRFWKRLP